MNKVLYIQDCYFKLPEDFSGTCGNALMLLALHRLEQEERQSISNESKNENRVDDFWNSDRKCTMAYCISTEEAFRGIENDRKENRPPLPSGTVTTERELIGNLGRR